MCLAVQFLAGSYDAIMSLSADGVVMIWRAYVTSTGIKYDALAMVRIT